MPEKVKCPLCGKRIFDAAKGMKGEIEIKCPHCHKVVKIQLRNN